MTARPRWRRIAVGAAQIATIGVTGAFVLPLVPVWPCSLLEHFRVQYLIVGIAVVAGAGALRLRGWFDAAALATLATLCLVVPGLRDDGRELPAGGTPVRMLLLNVHTANGRFTAVTELIAEVSPDVVALVEVDRRWIDALAPALAAYPGRIEHPRDDNFGVALYARGEVGGGVESLGSELPTVVATITAGPRAVHLILTHPLPPMSGAALASQIAQLDAVAARAAALPRPVVVAGDLNPTPWSRPFLRLIDAAGLCDSRAGFGLQASFPADSTILAIPIDHVLTSCSIGVRARRIERDVGSDHLPVVVDLVIP